MGNKSLRYRYCSVSQEVKAMKFVQLTEYIIRDILPKKSYTKRRGKTPFSKKSKFGISLDH